MNTWRCSAAILATLCGQHPGKGCLLEKVAASHLWKGSLLSAPLLSDLHGSPSTSNTQETPSQLVLSYLLLGLQHKG